MLATANFNILWKFNKRSKLYLIKDLYWMIFIAIQVLYPLVISFPECRMRHCISFWLPISFCEDFFFSHSTPLGTWLESSIRLYTFILCCHLFGILAHTKTVFVNFALLAVFFLRRWLTWLWYWNNFVGQYLYLKWAAANAAASTSASKNCAPKCVCFLFSLVRYFNFRLVEKKMSATVPNEHLKNITK